VSPQSHQHDREHQQAVAGPLLLSRKSEATGCWPPVEQHIREGAAGASRSRRPAGALHPPAHVGHPARNLAADQGAELEGNQDPDASS